MLVPPPVPPPVELDAPLVSSDQAATAELAAAAEPSPFSPTKKLRAMSLATRASPRFGGCSQSRNIMLLYHIFQVQRKQNARLTFQGMLRNEYPRASGSEIAEMLSHVECTLKLEAIRTKLAEQRWTDDEKKRLATFFDVFDADGNGMMSLHELLEFGALAALSRLSLKAAFAAASASTSVRDVSGPPIEDKTGTEITRAQFARGRPPGTLGK